QLTITMKKIFLSLFAAGAVLLSANANEWVRINQLGYLPSSVKVAVMMSEDNAQIKEFELVDSKTKKTVARLKSVTPTGKYGKMESTYRLDFSG
ncbi:cellulase N-terminal Ig-like domain-containing protein, partial [Acinetobacter baumannii]|nr:cellulase N-terminal Ig-like domain-containing protein [Acinetobacter baumannii]